MIHPHLEGAALSAPCLTRPWQTSDPGMTTSAKGNARIAATKISPKTFSNPKESI
jgi:hypothetical protein